MPNHRDKELLEESLEVLERVGCQFWACGGPTLRPGYATTCFRCSTVARLAKRLGVYCPVKARPKVDDSETTSYLLHRMHDEFEWRNNRC